jgi:hypothetical protein
LLACRSNVADEDAEIALTRARIELEDITREGRSGGLRIPPQIAGAGDTPRKFFCPAADRIPNKGA